MNNDEHNRTVQNPKNYFAVHKIVLKLIGVPFTTKRTPFFKIYGPIPIIILSTYSVFVLLDAFRSPINIDEISTNIFYGSGISVATIKHLIIYINRLKLREIMDTMENDPYLYGFKYRNDDDTASIRKCVDFTRKMCIVGETIAFLSIVQTIAATSFTRAEDGNRILPFGRMSYLQERSSYEAVFLFESTTLIFVAFVHMICDIIYATIAGHICVQLQILKKFIKRINLVAYNQMITKEGAFTQLAVNDNGNKLETPNLQQKYLQEMLIEAVKYHLAILNITEKVDKLFSKAMLTEFGGMSVCIIFLLYQASLYPLTDIRALKQLLVLITAALPLILMSYWGNEVTLESQDISAACYEMNFIGTDVGFQKDLLMIMQRSQKPIVLTVGKFATLSLITLVAFFRVCYSYYMVLQRTNSK